MDEYEVDVFALFCLSHAYDLLSEEEKTKLARVRLFLCIVIDHATKMILSMRLSPAPSDENAKAALSMVEQDKSIYSTAAGCLTAWTEHCGLATVAMDGGYATEDIRMSIAMGGGTSAYMPKGHPAMRGTVESIFATVGARVLSEYEGKAFSNTLLREDYKSEKRAGATIDEIALVMCTWVFDDYHNSPHAGLKGLTPREAWKRGFELFDLRPPLDAHGRRCAYGQRVTRTLTAEGFEFFGNFYREHRHLPKLYDPKKSYEFECFVDQRNLGAIGVIVGERVIAVPCATHWMEGVDAIDWVETNKRFQVENADRRVFEREAVRHAMERTVAIKGNAIHRQLISATVWNADQISEIQASTFTPYTFVSSAAAAPLGERIEPVELPPHPPAPTEPEDPPAPPARKWETE
jgi:putative transposase